MFIFATRKSTKKYQHILRCPNVSILLHDFPHLHDSQESKCYGQNFSITLNGIAECIDDREELSSYYRSIHLSNNKEYGQFIRKSPEQDSPTVFLVRVDKARICDIMDQVKLWNR